MWGPARLTCSETLIRKRPIPYAWKRCRALRCRRGSQIRQRSLPRRSSGTGPLPSGRGSACMPTCVRRDFASPSGQVPLKTNLLTGRFPVHKGNLPEECISGGERETRRYGNTAYDTCIYNRFEIERILKLAFRICHAQEKASDGGGQANVLGSSVCGGRPPRRWKLHILT